MRGVRCVQIPTTLLAMADSSVGGKTAVDIPAGKNLVGAFHQPSMVLVDLEFLSTLPEREYASGMAEVVKYGAIASEELFSRIESELPGAGMAMGHNAPTTGLQAILADCIRVKRDIVEEDEREDGRRKILNFGHTFGHAIEVKYGFSKYTHGQAVAAGMRIATRFGERLGITKPGTEARLGKLLAHYDLDIDESTQGLIEHMKHDKKAVADSVSLILLWGIGKAAICEMDFEKISAKLEDLVKCE
jgi:3-dehydroquinate synthase